ncbi:MAG: hypothetical protein IJC26_08510 [Clostridia bacterium]|nr:hypothetical protein [Clostridia bacterium]
MWRSLDESERGFVFRNSHVLCDEVYKDLCRLTAERCDGHVAVVCTVYGVLIQSVICEEESYPFVYKEIKEELSRLLEKQETRSEKKEALFALFQKYGTVEPYRRKIYERSTGSK